MGFEIDGDEIRQIRGHRPQSGFGVWVRAAASELLHLPVGFMPPVGDSQVSRWEKKGLRASGKLSSLVYIAAIRRLEDQFAQDASFVRNVNDRRALGMIVNNEDLSLISGPNPARCRKISPVKRLEKAGLIQLDDYNIDGIQRRMWRSTLKGRLALEAQRKQRAAE